MLQQQLLQAKIYANNASGRDIAGDFMRESFKSVSKTSMSCFSVANAGSKLY